MHTTVIGIMGTSQINHIAPALEEKYEVVNLQQTIDDQSSSKVKRLGRYLEQLSNVDVLYNVFTGPRFWQFALLAKLMGKRVVTHWIGSDVRLASEGRTKLNGLRLVDRHLVCFEPLQEDLARLGIDARVLPIVPFGMTFDICEMPEKHSAIIYLPEGKEELYGLQELDKVFPLFPDLDFYIVANGRSELFREHENVYALGMLSLDEMADLYSRSSVLIRIHLSDGLSMMVLEALGKGKSVIWDHEFPYVLPGKNANEISASLKEATAIPPAARKDAHDFIAEHYSKRAFMESFDSLVIS